MSIKWFRELSRRDTTIAGGKGASLGEMTQAGIPVPPGFVVTTDAFDRFLREAELEADIETILHTVNHEQVSSVERASEHIRALILAAAMPEDLANEITQAFKELNAPLVAVRSSATAEDGAKAAWAGQLESFLNTNDASLLNHVKACWASLFTPRALFYRHEQNLPTQTISVAVVVQAMVESEVSGIAFSVHPISEDRNQLLIEASYGLGEAIVSGQVTPDNYVVEKEPRRILETNVHAKTRGIFGSEHGNAWQDVPVEKRDVSALTTKQIEELAELVIAIERHYGFPCDIEWAFERGTFYIVQSRPITTLKMPTNNPADAVLASDLKHRGVFERVVQFPSIPVIYIEAMLACYEPNAFAASLGLRYAPTTVYWLDDQTEGWIVPQTKIQVTDQAVIELIDRELQRFAQEAQKMLAPIVSRPIPDYVVEELREALLMVNRVSTEIYQRFIFLTDELLNPSDDALIHRLQETRLHLDGLVVNYLFKAYENLICAFTDEYKMSSKIVERATTAELLRALAGETLSETELEGRAIAFVFINGTRHTLLGGEAKAVAHALREQDPTRFNQRAAVQEGQLTGGVGHKGKVTGYVRVLRAADYQNQTAIAALREAQDYILVTPMTRPELVPYIKNAKAFVTDEGGVTCHAAIIAREMGKPCVIGTKFATQMLEDGDLVEVDANEGVVRVLNSS